MREASLRKDILERYPFPIAAGFARYESARNNDLEAVRHLESLFEVTGRVVSGVLLSEYPCGPSSEQVMSFLSPERKLTAMAYRELVRELLVVLRTRPERFFQEAPAFSLRQAGNHRKPQKRHVEAIDPDIRGLIRKMSAANVT